MRPYLSMESRSALVKSANNHAVSLKKLMDCANCRETIFRFSPAPSAPENHGHLLGDVPALLLVAALLTALTPRGRRAEIP